MNSLLGMLLLAQLPATPVYDGRREFDLDQRLSHLIVAFADSDNQSRFYQDCDAELLAQGDQAVQIFPPPARMTRRTTFRINAMLKDVEVDSLETVILQEKQMTLRAELYGAHPHVEAFFVHIDLTARTGGGTHVTARLKLELRDVGGFVDRTVARVGLVRIERALRALAAAAGREAADAGLGEQR